MFKNHKRWRLCAPSAQLISDFGDLKLRHLPKSFFFSNGLWQNQLDSYDVITAPKTSLLILKPTPEMPEQAQ